MATIQMDPANLQALKNHLDAFDKWSQDRDELVDQEQTGGYADYSYSDDDAVDLLRDIATVLKETIGDIQT